MRLIFNLKSVFRNVAMVSTLVLGVVNLKANAHSASFGNGVVDGNGAPIGPTLRRIPMPLATELSRFVNDLAVYEPTLARLISTGFDEFSGIQWNYTPNQCFLSIAPTAEIRAAFQFETRYVILCDGFHRLSTQNEKIATLLHEMIHYVLQHQIRQYRIARAEESFVSLLEGSLLDMLNARTSNEYFQALVNFRWQLDRDLPELLLQFRLNDIAMEPSAISLTANGSVLYPVPKGFFGNSYFPQHFFETALNRLWRANPSFRSENLLALAHQPASEAAKQRNYLCAEFPLAPYPTEFRCRSNETTERHAPAALLSPLFKQFLEKFKTYSGRDWVQDERHLYFFVE